MNKPVTTMIRPCTRVWLVLVGLTLFALAIGKAGLGGPAIVAVLLVSTLIKTQLVADYFMGLKHSRLLWRMIVSIYLLLITGLIGLAYWLGMT